MGNTEAASQTARQAFELNQKKWLPTHPVVADSHRLLGKTLLAQRDPGGAEPMLRKSLEIRSEVFSEGDTRIAEAQSDLGSCLIELKRYEEAEELLLAGYRNLQQKGEAHVRQTQSILSRLVELYQAWGQDEKAAEYRALLAPSRR